MGGAVSPPFCLTWGQTMVEVMEIMATSFRRSQHALLLWVPLTLQQATADPHLCLRLLDTHGKVWVSLFWGYCSFFLVLGMHKVLFVQSKSLFPQPCVSSGSSMVGLMAISSKRACAIPRSAAPRAPAFAAGHCWPAPPQETLTHMSCSVSVGPLGPDVHKVCLSLQVSQAGMGFDSKCNFAPPTILLGLLFWPWMWGIFFLVGSNILLLTVIQQRAVIFEFSQEKMSTCPTPPSSSATSPVTAYNHSAFSRWDATCSLNDVFRLRTIHICQISTFHVNIQLHSDYNPCWASNLKVQRYIF